MYCILSERKFCPLSESAIKILPAITLKAVRRILYTPLFDPKTDIWGTSYLPMTVEIKYTWLILEEYIKIDLQPNLWRDWVIFGNFVAILV